MTTTSSSPSTFSAFASRLAAIVLLGLVTTAPGMARDWYVAGQGDDSHDGTTLATAFRTLEKAAHLVEPGDTVLVADGVYLDSPPAGGKSLPSVTDDETIGAEAVLRLTKPGRPDAWITWKALPGHRPEIRPISWAGISIQTSYVMIDGLTVTGANDSIVLLDAINDGKQPKANPYYNTNGIVIEGRHKAPDAKPHHIIIRHCVVSKCPGGGLTALEADYFTFEDNLIFDNAWFMRYGGSGITSLNAWAHDDAPGYHIVIQRNLVWNNKTLVPWVGIGKLSDGNGILLDVTDGKTEDPAANPQGETVIAPDGTVLPDPNAASLNPKRPVWKNRSLIANNVSAFNGGSGIHTYRTRHVDIINNTTYWNGGIVGYADLFSNSSEDVVILNNIIVPRPGGQVTSNNANQKIRWDYNLYPAAQNIFKGAHDIVADPLFVNVRPDLREADFHLQPASPARDSGTDDLAQPTDLTGKKRPTGQARDRGAYEQ